MILLFLSALFVFAFLFQIGKRTKLSVFVLLLGIISTYALGSGPVTEIILSKLQTTNAPVAPVWKETNLIIVLGSGQVRWQENFITPQVFGISRTTEAGRLYLACKKSGKSCTVITAGGDPSESGEPEALTMKALLVGLGVPESDILTETESRNTYENAKNVFNLVKEKKFENTLLVTSGFHMQRSELCFRLNTMVVTPAPADRLQAFPVVYPHVANLYFNNLAAHEYAGILKAYFVYTTGISF